MRSLGLCVATVFLAGGLAAGAQSSKKPQPRKAPAAQPAPLRAEAQITCPAELGQGVKTRRRFCDVLTGQDPKDGLLVTIPPHRGTVALSFELHNRHMYSEELIKAKRAFRQYTATIGVFFMDNTLIDRAIVQSEFRTAADLVDRIEGGAGAGGVKAVAPAGAEVVRLELPEDVGEQVSILGEVLKVRRPDGDDLFQTPGRPIATISNVMLEYRPAPVRAPAKAPTKKPAAKPPAATPKKP
jgi:hypothetical protein